MLSLCVIRHVRQHAPHTTCHATRHAHATRYAGAVLCRCADRRLARPRQPVPADDLARAARPRAAHIDLPRRVRASSSVAHVAARPNAPSPACDRDVDTGEVGCCCSRRTKAGKPRLQIGQTNSVPCTFGSKLHPHGPAREPLRPQLASAAAASSRCSARAEVPFVEFVTVDKARPARNSPRQLRRPRRRFGATARSSLPDPL
jgi:hypothetical protein